MRKINEFEQTTNIHIINEEITNQYNDDNHDTIKTNINNLIDNTKTTCSIDTIESMVSIVS